MYGVSEILVRYLNAFVSAGQQTQLVILHDICPRKVAPSTGVNIEHNGGGSHDQLDSKKHRRMLRYMNPPNKYGKLHACN